MKKIILISILMLMLPAAFAQETLSNNNAAENKTARNTLTFNPFHIFLGNVQFSYERILPSGKISLLPFASVPVLPLAVDIELLHFNAGMGIRYYPTGQGMIKYYTGFSASAGYHENYYGPTPFKLFSNLFYDKDYDTYGWFGNTLIHNGVVIYPGKKRKFNMGLNMGIGAIFTQAYWYTEVYDPYWGWVTRTSNSGNVVLAILEFSFTIGFKY